MSEPTGDQNNTNNPARSEDQQPASSAGEFNVIDADPSEPTPSTPLEPIPGPYDAQQYHDKARKHIAMALLFLLAGVVAIYLLGLLLLCPKPTFEQYKSVLEMLLTPLLTLVSAATGFYFGSQSK